MVEFGLITPVFFLVFFSIVEFSLITASIGSYDFAARDGARVGAIFGPTDPCIDTDPGTAAVTCSTTSGTVTTGPTGITGILSTIKGHVQGLVMAQITEVEIFDADPNADPNSGLCISSAGGTVPVDAAGCQEEEYPIASDWTIGSPKINTWLATSRNDAVNNADFIGVTVWYQYTYVTGFVAGLGTNLTLSATSVQRIEPLTTSVHRRGSPVTLSRARDSSTVAAMAARLPVRSPYSPAGDGTVSPVWWRRGNPGGGM